jgi:hypothetical protein
LDKETYIAEEAFIVLHSGEIPEIALYSSLYYLAEDPEGPGLELNAGDISPLIQAVARRYRAIILRDLEPGNRDKRSYRGLARCAVNWQRLLKFCTREGLDFSAIRAETAEALQNFLVQEVADVGSRKRASSINCSQAEIDGLAKSVGLAPADLPDGWQKLCPADA